MTTKKIVRRPDYAGGGVAPDELDRMRVHADKWIGNAMRTDRADPTEVGELQATIDSSGWPAYITALYGEMLAAAPEPPAIAPSPAQESGDA